MPVSDRPLPYPEIMSMVDIIAILPKKASIRPITSLLKTLFSAGIFICCHRPPELRISYILAPPRPAHKLARAAVVFSILEPTFWKA